MQIPIHTNQPILARTLTLLAFAVLLILLTGCETTCGSNEATINALGKLKTHIVERDYNLETAVVAQIESNIETREALIKQIWGNKVLDTKLSVYQRTENEIERVSKDLIDDLDSRFEPVLASLRDQLKNEQDKVLQNNGGDIGKVNSLAAQLGSSLANLVKEHQRLRDTTKTEFINARSEIFSYIDNIEMPDELKELSPAIDVPSFEENGEKYRLKVSTVIDQTIAHQNRREDITKNLIEGFTNGLLGNDATGLTEKIETSYQSALLKIETKLKEEAGNLNIGSLFNKILNSGWTPQFSPV